jgi:hypothetical protein
LGFADLLKSGEAVANLLGDLGVGGAAGRGEREVDLDLLFGDHAGGVEVGRERDAVNQAEVDDVDRELRVIDVAKALRMSSSVRDIGT